MGDRHNALQRLGNLAPRIGFGEHGYSLGYIIIATSIETGGKRHAKRRVKVKPPHTAAFKRHRFEAGSWNCFAGTSCAVNESLARRLLRLSSGGSPPILSGRTLKNHLGPELDRALGRRVLVKLPRLDEWPPCAGCDQGCEARPIRELDGRLVAMCPHDFDL